MDTGLSVKPDIVVVGLYLNDADLSPVLQITRVPPPFNQSHLIRFIFGNVDSIRAKFRLHKWEEETAPKRDQDAAAFERNHKIATDDGKLDLNTEEGFNRLIADNFNDWGYAWSDGFWKRVLPLIDAMNEVCKENESRVVFVFFPVAQQVARMKLRNEPQIRFEEELTKRQIAHLDLLPALREQYKHNNDLLYDHCHLKPGGNEFVGQTIGRFLNAQVISK